MNNRTVLIIYNDKNLFEAYSDFFKVKGYKVVKCKDREEILDIIEKNYNDIIIVDSVAMNLEKIENKSNKYVKKEDPDWSREKVFLGLSEIACSLRDKAKAFGKVDSPVLIQGETGTGKEIIANIIHRNSRRKAKPFICVNCGALNENLIESALFGNEKGAYTGATSMKKGYFEIADGGTIFLDEIGELSHNMQVKLLRVLQEKSFERVGGTDVIKSDFRIICATNKNLKNEVAEKSFRADLYYRINVLPIEIPPLRERKDDIAILCEYFRIYYSEINNISTDSFPEQVMNSLVNYEWPGNVRELRNIVERLVVLSNKGKIQLNNLPEEINICTDKTDNIEGIKNIVINAEKSYIKAELLKYNGNVTEAAKAMKISRQNLYKKISKYNIKYK